MKRAYYSASTAQFVASSAASILGELAENSEFGIELTQKDAWLEEIRILKAALTGVDGTVFLEFVVPRIGSRIDAVVISGPVIFVIEFKVGNEKFTPAAMDQVWDYALDLKNFHQGSHDAAIVPILVATRGTGSDVDLPKPYSDRVYPPTKCDEASLSDLITAGVRDVGGVPINAEEWSRSSYHPTPTIIEAARALYAHHSVDEIARNDAGH